MSANLLDEVKQKLRNRIDEIGAERLRGILEWRSIDEFIDYFANDFMSALAASNSEDLSRNAYMIYQILNDQQLWCAGDAEETIGNITLEAESPMSLQEKINLVLHHYFLREGGNDLSDIFRAAGIERMARRAERRQELLWLAYEAERPIREEAAAEAARVRELHAQQMLNRDAQARAQLSQGQRLMFNVALFQHGDGIVRDDVADFVFAEPEQVQMPMEGSAAAARFDHLFLLNVKVPDRKLAFFINKVAMSSYSEGMFNLALIKSSVTSLDNQTDHDILGTCFGYTNIDGEIYEAYGQHVYARMDALNFAVRILNCLPQLIELVTAIKDDTPIDNYNLQELAELRTDFPDIFNDDLLAMLNDLKIKLESNPAVVARLDELRAIWEIQRQLELDRRRQAAGNAGELYQEEERAREDKREKMLAQFYIGCRPEEKDMITKEWVSPLDELDNVTVTLPGEGEPRSIICPITQRFMVNPAKLVQGGHTFYFERDALERWLATSNMNPSTGLPLDNPLIEAAPEMQEAITRVIQEQLSNRAKKTQVLKELAKLKPLIEDMRKRWAWGQQDIDRPLDPKPTFRKGKKPDK